MSRAGLAAVVLWLVGLVAIASCTHQAPDRSGEEESAISQLTAGEVNAQLAVADKELADLDTRIRSAESRRDQFRLQQTGDPNKEGAVEGAEAELASLQGKRASLQHRQHLLEARARNLTKD